MGSSAPPERDARPCAASPASSDARAAARWICHAPYSAGRANRSVGSARIIGRDTGEAPHVTGHRRHRSSKPCRRRSQRPSAARASGTGRGARSSVSRTASSSGATTRPATSLSLPVTRPGQACLRTWSLRTRTTSARTRAPGCASVRTEPRCVRHAPAWRERAGGHDVTIGHERAIAHSRPAVTNSSPQEHGSRAGVRPSEASPPRGTRAQVTGPG